MKKLFKTLTSILPYANVYSQAKECAEHSVHDEEVSPNSLWGTVFKLKSGGFQNEIYS